MIVFQANFYRMFPVTNFSQGLLYINTGILKLQFLFSKKIDWNFTLWPMGKWKIVKYISWKWLMVKQNGAINIWDSWVTSGIYMYWIWHCSIQGHFWVIWCTFLKMTCNSKMAGCKAKQIEIWGSGGISMGYLWPCSVKSNLRVIQCTCHKKV